MQKCIETISKKVTKDTLKIESDMNFCSKKTFCYAWADARKKKIFLKYHKLQYREIYWKISTEFIKT